MRGSGYVNAYAEQRKRRPRQDVCGHARSEPGLPDARPPLLDAAFSTLTKFRCLDCGHTWLEVKP